MANDNDKNAATPNASNPSNAASPSRTDAPAGAGSATPNPKTPDAPLSENTTTPGVGKDAARSSAGASATAASGSTPSGSTTSGSAASSPRPVTTSPAAGDPTVDRLSLDPADSDDWVARTKLWVEENPVLAVLGAVGLGLIVGRLVVMAMPEPEPKTLTGKIEKRAHELAKQGRYVADDAGDAIARQLAIAAEALGEASGAVAKNAKKGYSEARDFSETIAEAIGEAFSKKAGNWLEKLS